MKKLLFAILFSIILLPAISFGAAITCTETQSDIGDTFSMIKLVCTGGTDNTTISLSADGNEFALGKYLASVWVYKTSGGDQPDAADVQVKVKGLDLLGAKGANLIPATDITNRTRPYNTYNALYDYMEITGDITVPIANQGTSGADYTIELIFTR